MDKFWLVLLEMNLKSTFYMSRGLDLLIKPGRLLKFLSEFIVTIVDCHKQLAKNDISKCILPGKTMLRQILVISGLHARI